MQGLDDFDFMRGFRFKNQKLNQLEPNADLSTDDPIIVALMTTLQHCGADVHQRDEMVSFCLQFDGGCLMGTSTVKCVSVRAWQSLKALQLPHYHQDRQRTSWAPPHHNPPLPLSSLSSWFHPSSLATPQPRRGLK